MLLNVLMSRQRQADQTVASFLTFAVDASDTYTMA